MRPRCFCICVCWFLQEWCGPWVFLIFMTFLVIFFIFTFLKVPETKGKTFEEISRSFASGGGAAAAAASSSPVEARPHQPEGENGTAKEEKRHDKEKLPLVEKGAGNNGETEPLREKAVVLEGV